MILHPSLLSAEMNSGKPKSTEILLQPISNFGIQVEHCPRCEAKQFDSVALPIERFSRLVIFVEDPDKRLGYEKER